MKSKNKPKAVSYQQEGIEALQAALDRCARGWGWWNPEDPPIVAELPDHPMVRVVIDCVRHEERAKYAAVEQRRKAQKRKK